MWRAAALKSRPSRRPTTESVMKSRRRMPIIGFLPPAVAVPLGYHPADDGNSCSTLNLPQEGQQRLASGNAL